jgi:hypothetical protein
LQVSGSMEGDMQVAVITQLLFCITVFIGPL